MWDSIELVPDKCLSFYYEFTEAMAINNSNILMVSNETVFFSLINIEIYLKKKRSGR